MNIVTGKWSFYINGALIALLIVFCLYLFDDSLGMGDGMVVVSEYCNTAVKDKAINPPPALDWQTGFLCGIFIGALAASIISGKWKIRFMQDSEGDGIAATFVKTIVFGLAGGFLVMLGLQLAGMGEGGGGAGCTRPDQHERPATQGCATSRSPCHHHMRRA